MNGGGHHAYSDDDYRAMAEECFIGREKRKTTATVKPDVSYPGVSAVT
jgi:hypothetical protein